MDDEKNSIFVRFWHWVSFLPVWAGYRMIWLAAKTGNPDAEDVYMAMWKFAGLDLPRIEYLIKRLR